ncbi:alkylation response protein AidB-like acyl-CoA dehydrogenase [Acidovorax soli]|uniref:3-methylmercaptopropionyl-CoA dehydrogenase n=1 Tax=Acidovorax soli TaxID=592050 RepID=A0A7X0U7I3_9BURK|nr:acyl-CoA dehydrogenase [Acidovorax soli]MBB6557505.1 alkylation response protein AidB-like acyl-CoA dehydrogenase [Acidovorax soli]
MSYRAPIKDMLFTMRHVAGIDRVTSLPNFEEFDLETIEAVLEESAKLCEQEIAPLNAVGDREPSRWSDGSVVATPGFQRAFQLFADGGWQGLGHPQAFGGQGLPKLVASACSEMLQASNVSFGLCPMLTDGAIEALITAASPELREKYAQPLIMGKWTGTMNLTEPQAGSDLAAVRTRAEPHADGSYRVFGTKIFITWGEHDMAQNIVHLVLARLPDAPPGVKGISLFVVPKFLVSEDGSLGARNDVQCVSIEHKLGIKASPTAVLQFGCADGAVGELVGEAHQGLKYMFIMMNAARFAVGMQGIGVADRAYQQALAFARERVQGRDLSGTGEPVAIVQHPDVKRMLLTMKAVTESGRALAYVAAAASDLAHHSGDESVRQENQSLYEFLVPVIKGHCTEMSVEIASLGVQIHGGMGFIEETGAAQHYRDARILPIYEGTTAIQANDFVGRKTMRDGGVFAIAVCTRIAATERELAEHAHPDCQSMRLALQAGRRAFEAAIEFVVSEGSTRPAVVYAGAVHYLRLAGIVLCGWQMARSMLAAMSCDAGDSGFSVSKVATALFYAETLLPQSQALATALMGGGTTVERVTAEML